MSGTSNIRTKGKPSFKKMEFSVIMEGFPKAICQLVICDTPTNVQTLASIMTDEKRKYEEMNNQIMTWVILFYPRKGNRDRAASEG